VSLRVRTAEVIVKSECCNIAMAALSLYNSRPFARHLTVAKRVLRYLKQTKDYYLHFYNKHDRTLTGSTDSEWASDSADRRAYIHL
jgi:hypothetical protein